jgi:antirestriction protein ArdC
VHWTGHRSRLGRDLSGRFGDHAYGAEELVAELGAAFWCAHFGMAQVTRDDHAAYLADWLRLLRADTRALVSACSHAQHAVDHLNVLAGHIVTV